MDINDYRIAWVHGIGHAKPGYSDSWREALNSYLPFPDSDYIETLWSSVFTETMLVINLTQPDIVFNSPEQTTRAIDPYKALTTTLQARGSAMAEIKGTLLLGEWSDITGAQEATGLTELPSLPWILDPKDYIGEFVDYLMNRSVRNAVKEKVKEQLRPLASQGYAISIIAHSWGTVVAYESLIDLEAELPNFKLANLFTLGSPLWIVHHLLDDRSGRKPHNTSKWINIHAQGDAIGSWLKPGFQVDGDFVVPNFKNSNNPHMSYFEVDNAAVQHDIVATAILEG